MVVGVSPTLAFYQRRRLFQALERVLPVQFAPRPEGSWRGLQAAIRFGEDAGPTRQVSGCRVPTFIVEDPGIYARNAGQAICFADVSRLDRRLRGQHMKSVLTSGGLGRNGVDHVDLATAGDRRLWQTSKTAPRVDRAAVSPRELGSGESLRDHLRAGKYLQLLPLLEFLREVTGYERRDAPIRATFIIDDPNLHWRSYGYVGFRSLAVHARANGYHVTFATVPLDCWFAWPGAARIFRASGDVLSLTSHGAYHLRGELVAGCSGRASSRLFEDAAARLDRFGRRWGVPVSRVMVPPHGLSALPVHDALLGAGFEALCTTLGWWTDWPEDQASIAGIAAADVSPAGLPVFARHSLLGRFAREDALISAYLGQPVVLYGHPEDLSDGYDLLARAASWLGSVSPTIWLGLGGIARTNVIAHFDAPRAGCVRELIIGGASTDYARARPATAPLKAYARRTAVETRDRLRPILRQLRLEPFATTVEEAIRARGQAAFHARQRRRVRDAIS